MGTFPHSPCISCPISVHTCIASWRWVCNSRIAGVLGLLHDQATPEQLCQAARAPPLAR
jgi:hypothetical protein